MSHPTRVFGGIPALNQTLFHRLRFSVGDPVAIIETDQSRTLILRDIEMDRARKNARVDAVHCPADFPPEAGLSGDRETATAQSLAECLSRQGITAVTADRTLPMSYTYELRERGIAIDYDPDLGVRERRAKDADEVERLRQAQADTGTVMTRACQTVARATANAEGILEHDGATLTSERLRTLIDLWLLEAGYSNPGSIVAGGPQAADCHFHGAGPLRTGEPVIIDIFPCHLSTRYNGDCTRTVVHGDIPEAVQKMQTAVLAANRAGMAATRARVTGEEVHRATIAVIEAHGYRTDRPAGPLTGDLPSMTHGTGHGIGLEVHEPPLLDFKGPELVVGDALTIEPALYSPSIGGVRVEDLVIVTAEGCENLSADLPTGLDWA